MIKNNIALLGIATKAGRVVSGGFMTERVIISGEASFVIIAEDASANTKKKFENKCKYYEVPYIIYGNKTELGHYIGKEDRTTIAVIDEGFGNQFIKSFGLSKDSEV